MLSAARSCRRSRFGAAGDEAECEPVRGDGVRSVLNALARFGRASPMRRRPAVVWRRRPPEAPE
jgi:hypothetical protein